MKCSTKPWLLSGFKAVQIRSGVVRKLFDADEWCQQNPIRHVIFVYLNDTALWPTASDTCLVYGKTTGIPFSVCYCVLGLCLPDGHFATCYIYPVFAKFPYPTKSVKNGRKKNIVTKGKKSDLQMNYFCTTHLIKKKSSFYNLQLGSSEA